MKGKGSSNPSGGGKKASSSDDEASCPLQLSDFDVIDVEKTCPRFHAVTNRTEDEGVGLEDLDVLQNEIETMLVSVTRRQISIESDIEALNSWNESTRPASSKLSKGGTPVKSEGTRSDPKRGEGEGKRKSSRMEDAVDSPRMNKRLKECVNSPLGSSASSISSCSSSAITASGSKLKQAKSKNISMKVQPMAEYHEPVTGRNHDIPDKFYAFIEPYCAPIKQENIDMLEEMLKGYDDDALEEYMKVPALGRHYTLKWSLNELTKNGSTSPSGKNSPTKGKKKKGPIKSESGTGEEPNDSFEPPSTPTTGKKGKKKMESSYGPFTQRLLQSLLETPSELGDAMTSLENTEDDEATEDNSSRPPSPGKGNSSYPPSPGKGNSSYPPSPGKGNSSKGSPPKNPSKTGSKKVTKALNLGNTAQLEKRIKKELEEAGLLELDDGSSLVEDEEDEILRELINTQNELKMVTQQNSSQLKLLLSKARVDMARQEIEGKLKLVDEEVIESYRKLTLLKSKKKNPTKKERDAAVKALKERDALIQQLDSLTC